MNNQILSIQNKPLSQISGPNVLKAGSSVYVKIIADKGNGQYLGSVAGNRVNINSGKTLQVGSSFVATINAKDGVIYITPKEGAVGQNLSAAQIGTIETTALQSTQISNLLASLGVPVTKLSGNLLKMMMQLEMKIDGGVLRGLYNQALKHKGKEKAAGEIITLLKQKGIDFSPEEIEELLVYLSEDFSDLNNNDKNKKAKQLINKSNKIEKGWTIVPYNLIEKNQGNDLIIGAGVIRMLFDKFNNLKQVNLNCYYKEKEFKFLLRFQNKKCSEIEYSIYPKPASVKSPILLLEKYINDKTIEIKWVEPSLIEGFGSEDEKIYSFSGEA